MCFFFLFGDLSLLEANNQLFWNRKVDRVMSNAIKTNVRSGIEVVEMGNNINDPEFSAKAPEVISALIEKTYRLGSG